MYRGSRIRYLWIRNAKRTRLVKTPLCYLGVINFLTGLIASLTSPMKVTIEGSMLAGGFFVVQVFFISSRFKSIFCENIGANRQGSS